MSYIDKVQVKGTDYDIRDNRMKLKDQISHGFRNNIVSSTSSGGVFNSFRKQFKSTVTSTTSIKISTGAAMKNGLYYSTVSDQTVTIPLASSGNARKDLIVVRWEIRDNSESTYGQLVRIAGNEVTGSTSAIPEPSYNDSVVNVDILTPGKTYTVDLPLYNIVVDGTNGIKQVNRLYSKIYDINYLNDNLSSSFILQNYDFSFEISSGQQLISKQSFKIDNIDNYQPLIASVLYTSNECYPLGTPMVDYGSVSCEFINQSSSYPAKHHIGMMIIYWKISSNLIEDQMSG